MILGFSCIVIAHILQAAYTFRLLDIEGMGDGIRVGRGD